MNEAGKYERLIEKTKHSYKALLYDCDGTLADNMQAHKDTYAAIAKQQGVQIDTAIIDEFAGLPIPAVVVEINNRYNSTFDPLNLKRRSLSFFTMNTSAKPNPFLL